MGQAAIAQEVTSPQTLSWNTNPLHFLRRELSHAEHLDDRTKSHCLKFLGSLMEATGSDPRQQAAVAAAAHVYALKTQVLLATLAYPAGSKKHTEAVKQLLPLDRQLVKLLQACGIKPGRSHGEGQSKTGTGLPPPREPRPSERSRDFAT